MAKSCVGLGKKCHFDLLFENASIKTIRVATQKQTKFTKYVALSAGDFDQFMFTKSRDPPTDFGEELEKIIIHLINNGVEKIYAIRPFPSPRMAGNDLKAWAVYQNIRESFDLAAKKHSNVQLMKFDALVMKRQEKKYGVFRDKNGKAAVNYSLFSNAFSITHNC